MDYTKNGNLNLPGDYDFADQIPLNENAIKLSHLIPYNSIEELKSDISLVLGEYIFLILSDRTGGYYKIENVTGTGALTLINGLYAIPVKTFVDSRGDIFTGNIEVPNAINDPHAPNWGQVKKLVSDSSYSHPSIGEINTSNSGTTVLQNANISAQGHTTNLTSKILTTADFVSPGTGIEINGKVVSHSDTSNQASVNNVGTNKVIQNITLDSMGHVTGLTSTLINLGLTFSKSVNGSLKDPGTGFTILWQECTFTTLSKSFTWHTKFSNAVYIAIPVDVCTASDHDDNGVDPYLVAYDTNGFTLRNRNGHTGRLCTCKILAIGW